MEQHNITLPKHWRKVTLDDIGVIASGGTPSTKDIEFWGDDIPWITPADLSDFEGVYIEKGQRSLSKLGLDYSSATLLPENSILFSSRAPIGYVAIAKKPLATNQGFKNIILSNSINPKFVYYYLKTIKGLAEEMASGTTFLEISTSKFKQIPFPLPPIEEQHRIVQKIEEVFSELDNNLTLLNKSKNDLQNYWQLSLRNAFKQYTATVSLGDVSEVKGGKRLPINHKYSESKTPYRYVRVTDFIDLSIDVDNLKYIDKKTFDELKNYQINANDIYISIAGTIGLVGTVPSSLKKAILTENAAKISLTQEYIPTYIVYFLHSAIGQEQIRVSINSTSQPKLALYKIKEFKIPNCSISEQRTIIQKIEETKSQNHELINTIEKNITQVEHIRFKTLQEAFLGKYSVQLKSDTDVDLQLQKIKAEKENYIAQQNSQRKKFLKSERSNLKLSDLLAQKFNKNPFSYNELLSTINISAEKINDEFDDLFKKKKIIKFFDEESQAIKYKLA